MATMEMDNFPADRASGCCLMVRSIWIRSSASVNSIPPIDGDKIFMVASPISKRKREGSDDVTLLNSTNSSYISPINIVQQPFSTNSKTNPPKIQIIGRYHTNEANSPPVPSSPPAAVVKSGTGPPRQIQKTMTITGELDFLISSTGGKGNVNLVRASSSNMMVFGHLGNIRQSGNANVSSSPVNSNNVLDYLPMTATEMESNAQCGKQNGLTVNVVKDFDDDDDDDNEEEKEPEGVFCRAISRRLDPEELKVLGNKKYKKGKFADALAYYDRAITLDPDKASYRSNKGAALIGLGQLLEAVEECKEAVRIEPSYSRAHHRLATLFHRLGEAEKAQKHYKLSGTESSPQEIAQAQALRNHLLKCNEARKLKDWHTLLKEAQCAISAGADSAPRVFASQAEACLKLHRHQEAVINLSRAPVFDAEALTGFFGAAANAYFLIVRAQVDMAAGRFEDAVKTAEQAAQHDSSNKEVTAMVRRAQFVASARSTGNDLFKASNYGEACKAYGRGLEHDAYNAVLLCNRAACLSKLGQFDKAINDCNSALKLRPSYSKARLRRADCNAKLERWEASIQDYEALMEETMGDEEVGQALLEVKAQLCRQRGNDAED